MSKAPETISISSADWWIDEGIGFSRSNSDEFDVEYIRKDIHEARIKELEHLVDVLKKVQYQQLSEVFPEFNKLACRVKELEEALRFYANKSNFAFYQYDPKEEGEDGLEYEFGTTARKALKESE